MVTFGKIHSELYLGQCMGETVGEVFRPMGTSFWRVRFGYNPVLDIKYVNLIDAKKAFENMCLRSIEDEYEVDYYYET